MKRLLSIILVVFILPVPAFGMAALLKKKNLNEQQALQVQKIAIYEAERVAEKILLERGQPSNNPVAPDIELDNSQGALVAALSTAVQVGGMFGIPGVGKLGELIIGGMTAATAVGGTGLQLYNNSRRKKIEVERDDAVEDAGKKKKMLKVVANVISARPAKEFKEMKAASKRRWSAKT